jgi:hypothetical protein
VVHAFEAEHGIVLPEPYRTFVAETADGSSSGPPEYGFVSLSAVPEGRVGWVRHSAAGKPQFGMD